MLRLQIFEEGNQLSSECIVVTLQDAKLGSECFIQTGYHINSLSGYSHCTEDKIATWKTVR